MPHYFLEGLENQWALVRETPSSQKFKVRTEDGHELALDIHYTSSKVLTVNICFVGESSALSKAVLTPVMDDLSKIALRRTDYAVIDYTLGHTDRLFDGNFSIAEDLRKVYLEPL